MKPTHVTELIFSLIMPPKKKIKKKLIQFSLPWSLHRLITKHQCFKKALDPVPGGDLDSVCAGV